MFVNWVKIVRWKMRYKRHADWPRPQNSFASERNAGCHYGLRTVGMAESMPAVGDCGRGWSTASNDSGKRLTNDRIVVNLSRNGYIDPAWRTKRLLCRCNRVAAEKHKCMRYCTCAKLGKHCCPPYVMRAQGAVPREMRITPLNGFPAEDYGVKGDLAMGYAVVRYPLQALGLEGSSRKGYSREGLE